jgi:hypothetical protein
MPGARLAALAAAVVLASGCGGTTAPGRHGTIAWASAPLVFQPRTLPHDRVLLGRIVNRGRRALRLLAARVVVRDAAGRVIASSSAAFATGYAHGLFGALQQPSALPVEEMARRGLLLYLQPGASAPFYAAWRLPAHAREPERIQVGPAELAVPGGRPRLTAR